MKKILFLMFFFTINSVVISANLYFDYPESNDVYYSGAGGFADIPYYVLDPSQFFYSIGTVETRIYVPGSGWTQWRAGRSGNYYGTKAGSYVIEARVWVYHDAGGGSNYYIYSTDINFSVLDNYAPSAPQDLTVSAIGGQGVSYPKLEWNLNTEDDVEEASQGYFIERRLDVLGNGNWSSWAELGNVSGLTNTYIDYTISDAGSGPSKAQYRIRAKDINNNHSNYSSVIEINYGTSQQKISPTSDLKLPEAYSINQNFPNPFNPITSIYYSVLNKGLVKLKVYDLLGNEIATLVDEEKEKGIYTVNFNGNNFSSGAYIYIIRVNNFVASKKMLLVK